MSVAQKEIKKFFGNSVLKNKDVQKALKYANESFEMNQLVGMLHEHVLNLTEKNLIPDIQKIVDTKGAAKVGGVMLDMFTASVITQAYAKVNDSNKKKMENSNIQTLVKLAQRLMGMKEELGLDEGRLSDLLIDIQQGATAKELARTWKIPLSVAKDFLADYYADKRSRTPRRESVQEGVNGMVGKKIRVRYRPARAVRGQPFKKALTSHSTIEKSDLFKDVESNAFDLRDDCNSIAIRVPHARGSEKDKMKWREMVNSSSTTGGSPAGLIRGGGLATSEVEELFQDMRKAAKEFKGDVLAQSHEISINNKKRPLNVEKGLTAMLKAIDEFGMRNHVTVSGRDGVLTQIQYAANHLNEEVSLQEGTWQIPDSYDKMLDLQKFLSKPHKAKTAREVHKFHIDADRYFGDDSFSDKLDAYYYTLPGGDVDPYDKKEKSSPKSMERAKKYNKIKPGTDLNILLMKALTDWTGGDLQFDRRGKITQSPRDWYEKNNPKLRNKSRVVKLSLIHISEPTRPY